MPYVKEQGTSSILTSIKLIKLRKAWLSVDIALPWTYDFRKLRDKIFPIEKKAYMWSLKCGAI